MLFASSFSLTFTAGRLSVFLIWALTAAAVWLYYRNTVPPVSRLLRALLAFLRGGALFLLAAVLLGGVLSITRTRHVNAPVSVLVDSSSSMGIGGGNREDTAAVKTFFSSREWEAFNAAHDVRMFAFSDTVRKTTPGELSFTGPITDMEQALRAGIDAAGANAAALLMISDGSYNKGGDPAAVAETGGIPVYTIASGDSGALADVIVTSLQLSAAGLAGHRIPVRVSVRGPGFAGETIRLELRSEGRLLDERSVRLPSGGFEKTETLHFKTDRPGYTAVSVRAADIPGEVSKENNEQTGFINITPDRIKVLLLAAGPHQDTAFIIRTLQNDPSIELTSRVLKDEEHFYEGGFPGTAALKTYDCVVLAGMPGRRMQRNVWTRISRWLREAEKPLFIQAGGTFDPAATQLLEPILPFVRLRAGAAGGENRIILTGAGFIHPVTGLAGRGSSAVSAWDQVPPFALAPISGEPKPQASVLAGAVSGDVLRQDSLRPVLLAGTFDGVKSVFLAGTGLFRWSMQPGRAGLEPIRMLRSTIRWLASPEKSGYYRLTLPKRVFETGEAVTFTCTAFDAVYRPLSGGRARLALWKNGDTLRAPMPESGDGEYRCTLAAPGTGRWRAAVDFSAFPQGREIGGRDSTQFYVQPFQAELQRIEPSPDVLRRVSSASGGRCVAFSAASALIDTLRFPQVTIVDTHTSELGKNEILLAVILLMLCVEWLIRKRKGMV